MLATGGHDGHVRLWDPNTGKGMGDAMRGHAKWVTGLAWEPVHMCVFYYSCLDREANGDDRNPTTPRLASSSKDGTVRVWSTNTRALAFTLGGHAASVNSVKWGGGGKGGKGLIFTASSDRTVRVWDPKDVRPFADTHASGLTG